MRVGMVCRQRQDRSRHGVVTVREWLSAIIEITYRPMTVASGPRGIRRGGDITAASPGVLGVIVSGQRGRSGMVFMAVVLST
jgi:hypothetical protein